MKKLFTILAFLIIINANAQFEVAEYFMELVATDLSGLKTSDISDNEGSKIITYSINKIYDVHDVIEVMNLKVEKYTNVDYVYYWNSEFETYNCMLVCKDVSIIVAFYDETKNLYANFVK